jgi:hypothetical protein
MTQEERERARELVGRMAARFIVHDHIATDEELELWELSTIVLRLLDDWEDHLTKEESLQLVEALAFYGDPKTYFAIGLFPDPPCGPFIDDINDTGTSLGHKPGKRAREVLAMIAAAKEE